MKILGFLMLSMVYMCSSGGSESDAELASLEMEEAVYDDVSFQDQNGSTDSEKVIEQKISNFIFTGIEWIPLNKIDIKKDNLQVILNFLETIEEDSDVQNVFSNMK